MITIVLWKDHSESLHCVGYYRTFGAAYLVLPTSRVHYYILNTHMLINDKMAVAATLEVSFIESVNLVLMSSKIKVNCNRC